MWTYISYINILLLSLDNSSNVVHDAQGGGVAYVFERGVGLEDIYFENDGPSGHTLYLENSSSTVRNCVFDNSETSKGTAITITGQDQNILENNTFQNFHCYIMKDGQCISPLP